MKEMSPRTDPFRYLLLLRENYKSDAAMAKDLGYSCSAINRALKTARFETNSTTGSAL